MALSVSISANISPSETVSPTCFNQLATVPSSMVSLKRGMVMISTFSGFSKAAVFSATGALSSLGAAASASPESSPEISSPSSPIIANKLSTGAVPPSSIPMCNKVPSKKASNSIVALSVSISARISPSFTLSPTFFNQEATVPSSMVSLKRGIVMISAMISRVYVV